VHHIFPKAKYPELLLEPNNGAVVCRCCHTDLAGKEEGLTDLFFTLAELGHWANLDEV
jgi:hypothetical protein